MRYLVVAPKGSSHGGEDSCRCGKAVITGCVRFTRVPGLVGNLYIASETFAWTRGCWKTRGTQVKAVCSDVAPKALPARGRERRVEHGSGL